MNNKYFLAASTDRTSKSNASKERRLRRKEKQIERMKESPRETIPISSIPNIPIVNTRIKEESLNSIISMSKSGSVQFDEDDSGDLEEKKEKFDEICEQNKHIKRKKSIDKPEDQGLLKNMFTFQEKGSKKESPRFSNGCDQDS